MATVLEHTGVRERETTFLSSIAAGRHLPPTPILFLSLFAAQAALVGLTPILPQVAGELGVSTAAAGQLRSVSGLAAGIAALAMGRIARRVGLRDLLVGGLGGLGAGSLIGATAPTFSVLAAAQVVVGASLAVVLSAGIAAAAAWAPEGSRSRVLSWTLAGQPTAWIVGIPITGALAGVGWRWALLVVPFVSATLALVAVRSRQKDPPSGAGAGVGALWRRPGVAGWALGEFHAYSAWSATLVFSGALFIESYRATPRMTGLLLAMGAAAYVPGASWRGGGPEPAPAGRSCCWRSWPERVSPCSARCARGCGRARRCSRPSRSSAARERWLAARSGWTRRLKRGSRS